MVVSEKENGVQPAIQGFAEIDEDSIKTNNQIKLFPYKMFMGPVEMNLTSKVSLNWNDDDQSGVLYFVTAHKNETTRCIINFSFVESCFGYTGTDHHKSAVFVKLDAGAHRRMYKMMKCKSIEEACVIYNIHRNATPFSYLTIFLNDSCIKGKDHAVALRNGIYLNCSEFHDCMKKDVYSKFALDRRRYYKEENKKKYHDYSIPRYETVPHKIFLELLKALGIQYFKQRSPAFTTDYKGTMPHGDIPRDIRFPACEPSSSADREDKYIEVTMGQKGVHNSMESKHATYMDEKKRIVSSSKEVTSSSSSSSIVTTSSITSVSSPSSSTTNTFATPPGNRKNRGKKPSEPELVSLDSDDDDTKVSPSKRPRKTHQLPNNCNITLHFDDMKGCFFNEMVNDNIVDLYLSIVHNDIEDPQVKKKTHVFTCFFYKRLTANLNHNTCSKTHARAANARFDTIKNNYSFISKWTRKVDIFSMDYLIIPVVDDLHWYLIIIVKPYKCIVSSEDELWNKDKARLKGSTPNPEPSTYAVICDSLYDHACNKRHLIIDIVRDYLELEFNSKKMNDGKWFDRTRIAQLRPRKLPQQTNYVDCGFFLLKYAESFLQSPPKDLHDTIFWDDMFPGTKILVKYQREIVYNKIKKMVIKSCPEAWEEYAEYEKEKRSEWDMEKREQELVHFGRRGRCHSETELDEERSNRRCHSEPPDGHNPPPSHFT